MGIYDRGQGFETYGHFGKLRKQSLSWGSKYEKLRLIIAVFWHLLSKNYLLLISHVKMTSLT